MKKNKILVLIALVLAAAFLFFREDVISFYSKFSVKLPQIEKDISNLVQEAQKQVLAPPPLRAQNEAKTAVLTKDGVVEWTNAQRAKFGLPPLQEDINLDSSAFAKVEDMFANQYFAHDSPLGVGAGDLAQEAGYEFIIIGENLALGNFENDETLVQAWMDSPGHRANILNANYENIGVAVGRGTFEGRTTWLAVQHFGKPLSACPQPSGALKAQIDSNKAQTAQLQVDLNVLQQEIQEMSKRNRQEFNQKVAQYNELVSRYNNLILETKNLVEQYNSAVRDFNACAGSL